MTGVRLGLLSAFAVKPIRSGSNHVRFTYLPTFCDLYFEGESEYLSKTISLLSRFV